MFKKCLGVGAATRSKCVECEWVVGQWGEAVVWPWKLGRQDEERGEVQEGAVFAIRNERN